MCGAIEIAPFKLINYSIKRPVIWINRGMLCTSNYLLNQNITCFVHKYGLTRCVVPRTARVTAIAIEITHLLQLHSSMEPNSSTLSGTHVASPIKLVIRIHFMDVQNKAFLATSALLSNPKDQHKYLVPHHWRLTS